MIAKAIAVANFGLARGPSVRITLPNLQFATIAASAAPEGGVQITFSSPPIILSAGASVSMANSASASFKSAEEVDGMAPMKQVFNGPDFRGDHAAIWQAHDNANHWEGLSISHNDLIAIV